MVNCTSSFLFTVVIAVGSKWAAANTSFIWASFCSRRSLSAVSFFSSKTFFSPIFCCSSNIAVTNRLCKSSRSCCSWNNTNVYVQYTVEAQYSFRTNEIWNLLCCSVTIITLSPDLWSISCTFKEQCIHIDCLVQNSKTILSIECNCIFCLPFTKRIIISTAMIFS